MADTFADLPDALVRDLLACASGLAEGVRVSLGNLRDSRASYRQAAAEHQLIKKRADLDVPREPSVCGIDGSYQLHRLTSMDLCAAAAVAVEGTSKEATRYWPEPYHRMWAASLVHNTDTTGALRALMVSMEMDLAAEAPHDLVLLDGAFASLIIYLNQGLAKFEEVPQPLATELRTSWVEKGILNRLLALLSSDRVVAVPKFTSRNELVATGKLPSASGVDGRTLATVILEPGEYTVPLPIYQNDEPYHLPRAVCTKDEEATLNGTLREVQAVYFRPFGWSPALRLEVPGSIANSLTRLSILFEGITRQLFSPAVLEPYPLFLADRMVKSLGAGVAVIEQTVMQHVADAGGDVELTMLCLQNYRTEGGRGGV